MIKNIRERNESVKPHDFELKKLRATLPEYFDKNGNFNLDRLQDTLQSNDVNLTKEGYELKFLGKSYAKYLTSTETEAVIVPDLKHNAEPKNRDSENLYIVGDNLDALKHLLGSYAGKVKCIYIDPPYNTGSDGFVYNDDFGFTPSQLVNKIGISEDEAQRVYDLQGKSSHSAWLTFMHPRLQLAKELLSDNGVIFISIDDNEQSNLKMLCDEIFGEQNFLANIVWEKRFTRSNNAKLFASVTEYIITIRKSESVKFLRASRTEKSDSLYSNPDNDPRGPWTSVSYVNPASKEERPNLAYIINNPFTKKDIVHPTNAWKYELSTYQKHVNEDRLWWGTDGRNTYPRLKRFLSDVSDGMVPVNLLHYKDVGTTDKASSNLNTLMEGKVFSFPKPVDLLRTLLNIGAPESQDIVLDFFSGSGTTAEAVLKLNSEDNGNRKYIMVQIPEEIDSSKPAYKAGYRTIDEIGRERIKRAAVKIKSETGADIDYGFRLFRLEEPSGQVLNDLEKFDPDQDDALFSGDYVSKFDNLDQQGTPGHDTILTTWLVQDGYGLTADTRQVELSGYSLDVCRDSAYIIEPGLTSDDVRSLVTMVENGKLDISRVVIFGYSVGFSAMHELKKNLSVLKSGKSVTMIERF